MGPGFKFKSSYRGESDFTVRLPGGEVRRLSVRWAVPERAGMNYTEEEFERDVAGCVGIVRWAFDSCAAVPKDVFAAFSAWWAAEGYAGTHPGLTLARGYYVVGEGWRRLGDGDAVPGDTVQAAGEAA